MTLLFQAKSISKSVCFCCCDYKLFFEGSKHVFSTTFPGEIKVEQVIEVVSIETFTTLKTSSNFPKLCSKQFRSCVVFVLVLRCASKKSAFDVDVFSFPFNKIVRLMSTTNCLRKT